MPCEQSSPVRLPPFVLALDAINTAHINPATRVPPTASRNVGTLHLPPVGPTTKENEVSYSPLSVRDISMNDESINHTDLDSSSVLMASHTFNGGTRPPSAMMMDDLVNESVRRQREMSDSCGGSRVFDIDCSSCAAAMADLNSESPEVAAPVSPPRPISTNTQICPMSRDDLIIRGLKIAFRDLTGGFEVDELIDELCVRAAWATEDVMIHCFCLINRLTRRHPAWYAKTDSAVLVPTHYYTPEEDTSPSSSIDSNTSSSFTINNARSSTHAHNPQPPIFYRESYIRCFLAITSISMKFHGDTAYRLRSLCALTNNIRDRQLNEEAKRNNNNEASAQIHVLDPKRLSVCERRMWRELTATVWVHGREYDQCAAFVLRCAT